MNDFCRSTRGGSKRKAWCIRCLVEKCVGMDEWQYGSEIAEWFTQLDEQQPASSTQRQDWHCPHCSFAQCPATTSCTSKGRPSRGKSAGSIIRSNPHHGDAPVVQAEIQTPDQLMDVARQQYPCIAHKVQFISPREVLMPQFKVKAGASSTFVKISATSLPTMPAAARRYVALQCSSTWASMQAGRQVCARQAAAGGHPTEAL